jgi:hypothetical protein
LKARAFLPTRWEDPGDPKVAEIDEWVKSGRGTDKEASEDQGAQAQAVDSAQK